MTTAWIDATAGVAGDMLLGALIDAGAPADGIQAALDAVVPGAIVLRTQEVRRAAMRAVHAHVVQVEEREVDRSWAAIRSLLDRADLAEVTRSRALAVFERIAVAEAHVHGMSVQDVHFHEVGGLDAIGDVVGTCEALRLLGVDDVTASWVALGEGRVHAAHGWMPVPAPAVVELSRGWSVRALPALADGVLAHVHAGTSGGSGHAHAHAHGHRHGHGHGDHHHHHDEEGPAPVADARDVGELATPTGLALLREVATRCGALPDCVPDRVGVGAGGKDLPGWANVVRVVLLDASQERRVTSPPAGPASRPDEPPAVLTEVAANLDDLDHRIVPGVVDALLEAGAVDAWAAPIHMKKGRPALTLSALVDAPHHDAVIETLLTRTTTLGVRETPVTRTVLDRAWRTLPLSLPDGEHEIVVKVGHRGGEVLHAQAEWSSVVALAASSGLTELDVSQRATAALVHAGLVPGSRLEED